MSVIWNEEDEENYEAEFVHELFDADEEEEE